MENERRVAAEALLDLVRAMAPNWAIECGYVE